MVAHSVSSAQIHNIQCPGLQPHWVGVHRQPNVRFWGPGLPSVAGHTYSPCMCKTSGKCAGERGNCRQERASAPAGTEQNTEKQISCNISAGDTGELTKNQMIIGVARNL
eukprot:scaffold19199_cov17-Tisochrysis_lutea.AAC.2